MKNTLSTSDEVARLRAVARYGILDTPPEETYDRITKLAARIFQVPVALVAIMDEGRIWFKSRYGLDLIELPRNTEPLASVLLQKETFFIEDASSAQALTIPTADGEAAAQFYTGVPLITQDGFNLGALCLIDTKPRTLKAEQVDNLQDFAALVMEQFKLRLKAIESKVKLENIKSSADNMDLAYQEFVATLGHELRSPLNSIIGSAQLLEMGNPSPSQLGRIKQILHAGWHQAKLIDDFLELVARKSPKDSLLPEPLPLFDVLNECHTIMKPQAQMKSIHLHLSNNDEPLYVYADRTKLKQVVINLLSNAIKYTPCGGQVTIEWEKNFSNGVRVRITDTGIGIPAEKMDQLFQPYNRLGQEDGPEEGMGIGLTVTRTLVELMGGAIGVASPEDAGSTFWIELPTGEESQFARRRRAGSG